jgi:hypothetical protein
MLLWIGVAMAVASVAGVPVLPVLIIGGICTGLLAYSYTRSSVLFSGAMSLAMLGVLPMLLAFLEKGQNAADMGPTLNALSTFLSSPWLVGTLAVVFMFFSAVYGIYGPQHGHAQHQRQR